jgi:NAD(P)-dependent dehydrogenase (short-subunit alcohol dehydrogenase family)
MAMSGYDLSGRVALVTGGGTGIGAATARLLASRGADLVLAGRRREPLEQAAAEFGAATGRRCLALPADVTDPEQVARLIAEAVAALGRLDILINNAGHGRHAPLRTMPPAKWQKDVALNLNAAFYCSQGAYPHLKASGRGAIVNVSSLAGVGGTLGVGAYAAAKAGLQMFTRVAAAEWGPQGIRVNAVACGMIATPLARANWAKTGFDAGEACREFPLRRPGEPEEAAEAIAFLASDAASYITGEVLAVAGGPQLKGMIDTDG